MALAVPSDATAIELAAWEAVENYLGQPVRPRVVTQQVPTHYSGTVLLHGRVLEVLSVSRFGQDVTDYDVNAAAGLLYGRLGGATVTYRAGFDPVPETINLAVRYAVQHAEESEAGAVVNGQGAGDEVFTLSRGAFLPPRAKELLDPYRFGVGVA